MDTPTDPAPDEARHRALASRTRLRLLELLRSGGRHDASELAGQLDLHVNTVRAHLAVLEVAGLVTSAREQRRRRGRPRVLFDAVPDTTHDAAYRDLAVVLADALASDLPGAADRAEAAGLRWGQGLSGRLPRAEVAAEAAALDRALAVLDRFGFAPRRDPGDPSRVVLERCPFRNAAEEHPEVICGVHRGMLRGALEAGDVGATSVELVPFVSPSRCEVRVAW